MIARPYTPEQHGILSEWWSAHGWTPVHPSLLPANGYIIWEGLQPLASGFLYLTDSKFCVMEWVLSNPKSDRIERGKALDLLLDSLLQCAKDNGNKMIFSSIKHPKLLERYKAHGFLATDEQMTSMIGRIE